MRASMDRPQFEQTWAVFASSQPDRPARRFQQCERPRLDGHSNSTRSAEQAALGGMAEEQARDPWTEVERGGHRHQALSVPERLDPKETEHVGDVLRPARVQPKAQL